MSQSYTKGIPVDTDPSMAANTDLLVPSQAAVVLYVANRIATTSVTGISVTAPLSSSGGLTPTLSMASANASTNGYLLASDWLAFNGKLGSLNGLTGSTQTFATGTAAGVGNDFNIVSSGTTHTFNIPDASQFVRGVVTTGTQTFIGAKTFLQSAVSILSGTTFNPFVVTSTSTNPSGNAITVTSVSGSKGITTITNGDVQYAGRASAYPDREIRMQNFVDGHAYVQQTAISGSAPIISDLVFRAHGIAGRINNGSLRFNLMTTAKMAITPTGMAVGSQATALTASAYLHLMAGTASADTAPLKFTSGTNLTTAETGAMEYNGTNLFFTRTGTTRENVFVGNDAAAAPATTAYATPTNYYGSSITNTLGEPDSWASVVIGGVTYKIPLYT